MCQYVEEVHSLFTIHQLKIMHQNAACKVVHGKLVCKERREHILPIILNLYSIISSELNYTIILNSETGILVTDMGS